MGNGNSRPRYRETLMSPAILEGPASHRLQVSSDKEPFPSLREQGLGVIDIGSRDGVHPVFKPVASLLNVIGFEPDREEARRLTVEAASSSPFRSLTYLPCGVGERDGQQLLHLCRSRGASSFYRPNRVWLDRFPHPERFDVTATVSVPVRSLDSLREDSTVSLPHPIDVLKIDTQGFALPVLQGARTFLTREVVAVEVEVEFARLYEGQPVFREVDALLADCGFTLFKFRRQEWVRRACAEQPQVSAGQLVFGDALYLRDPLASEPRWSPQDAHQAEALIVVASLYDLHDVALEFLAAPQCAELVNGEAIRRYLRWRMQRLNQPWRRLRSPADFLRMVKASLVRAGRFRSYPCSWARGDENFYSSL